MNNANTEQQLLYWSAIRINDIIADWYRKESGATVFKTFAQWKTDGFNIKKGSKAFILWSRKRTATKGEETTSDNTGASENKGISYEFFPISYLFSDLQVEKTQEGGNHAN